MTVALQHDAAFPASRRCAACGLLGREGRGMTTAGDPTRTGVVHLHMACVADWRHTRLKMLHRRRRPRANGGNGHDAEISAPLATVAVLAADERLRALAERVLDELEAAVAAH
jgi:hypothetical protein